MIRWELALLLVAAGLLSIYLIFKLVRSDRSRLDKAGGILLLAVPLVGPLLYWFVYNDLPPQHPFLQNHGPRGEYTHRLISIRPILDKKLDSSHDEQTEETADKQPDR